MKISLKLLFYIKINNSYDTLTKIRWEGPFYYYLIVFLK